MTHRNDYINTYIHINKYTICYVSNAATFIMMNNFLAQNCTSQRSTMTLLFKNYSLVEVIHLLIRSNKTTSLGQNAHTPHRERKITLKRVSKCYLVIPLTFCGKILNPLLFGKIQKTQTFPFYKGGIPTLALLSFHTNSGELT